MQAILCLQKKLVQLCHVRYLQYSRILQIILIAEDGNASW